MNGAEAEARAMAEIRSGRAISCGYADDETNTITFYREDGPWFTLDLSTMTEVPSRRDGPEFDDDGHGYISTLHRRADEAPTLARCYFIGGDEGRIKIGYSIDPKARLRALQLSSPLDLRILALVSGGIQREEAYHVQFAEHRAHGEWFERHPDILAEIERLSK